MIDLLEKIMQNPGNRKVLDFLALNNKKEISLRSWKEAYSAFDEGGCIFFDKYGKSLPERVKYSLEIHNIMVNENTGEIFAFHTGRFSIFFKCNIEKADIKIQDLNGYQQGYTFDCITDITMLGDTWCYLDKFEGEEALQLEWSYEITQK